MFLVYFASFKKKPNKKTKFKKVNNITTAFGNGSATSVNGPVSIATINYPMGISINPITQEVYIAENTLKSIGNIRGWNRTSQSVRTVYGALHYLPNYLDFQNDGTLFFTDTNGELMKLDSNGLFVYFYFLESK